jgi:membrane protease YdiL (CAAX protease family)
MQHYIRALPPAAEFVIVITICFGYFILVSLLSAFGPAAETTAAVYDEASLIGLLLIEALLLGPAVLFLLLRGWRLADFELGVSLRSSGEGIVLFALTYLLFLVMYFGLAALAGNEDMFALGSSSYRPNLLVAVLVSIVNPVFEEVFVVGYVIKALEGRYGATFAIGVSVLIRLLYHTYQGAMAVAFIFPMGVLFAVAYWRRRALWPLILAHGLFDFIGLMWS